MGGSWFREQFGDPNDVSNDHLVQLAKQELKQQLGINETPFRTIAKVSYTWESRGT